MGNIAQGRGREANIARGKAECYISPETTPTCNISCSTRASVSGTLTGLLQRIWSSISGTIFSRGEYSTLCALWKIKHSSALSSYMASYNKGLEQLGPVGATMIERKQ